LKSGTQDASVVIVAQRVSTIMHAERIIVLDDGRVVGMARTTSFSRIASRTTRSSSPSSARTPRYEHGTHGRDAWRRRAAQKSKDLRATLHRLLERLRPERTKLAMAIGLGVTSVAFMVSGPEILGNATNVLFDGLIGARLKPGTTKAQAIAMLRREGHSQIASMIGGMKLTPGIGVNIDDLGLVLGLAALVYLLGAAFSYFQGFTMAGLTQRVMSGLRRDVEAKLSRLPLRYFDSHPHGDVLSRVANDIDNLTTTIQQGLSQLLTSVLTIVGVMG